MFTVRAMRHNRTSRHRYIRHVSASGRSNPFPVTYVDNCAEAIVLAGVTTGVDGEVFNVVDDNLPTSRRFLRLYKQNVKRFGSLYIPHSLSYGIL